GYELAGGLFDSAVVSNLDSSTRLERGEVSSLLVDHLDVLFGECHAGRSTMHDEEAEPLALYMETSASMGEIRSLECIAHWHVDMWTNKGNSVPSFEVRFRITLLPSLGVLSTVNLSNHIFVRPPKLTPFRS